MSRDLHQGPFSVVRAKIKRVSHRVLATKQMTEPKGLQVEVERGNSTWQTMREVVEISLVNTTQANSPFRVY